MMDTSLLFILVQVGLEAILTMSFHPLPLPNPSKCITLLTALKWAYRSLLEADCRTNFSRNISGESREPIWVQFNLVYKIYKMILPPPILVMIKLSSYILSSPLLSTIGVNPQLLSFKSIASLP
jgi:hypothetical protein